MHTIAIHATCAELPTLFLRNYQTARKGAPRIEKPPGSHLFDQPAVRTFQSRSRTPVVPFTDEGIHDPWQ